MGLTGLLLFLGLLLLSAEQPAAPSRRRCRLHPGYGPCTDVQVKVYFDWGYQKCTEFFYGGCKGNNNRFETMEECELACGKRRDHCNLPPVQGPCKDYRTRYYYNWTQKECMGFTYGGCEGNKNRFRSAEVCEHSCGIKGHL